MHKSWLVATAVNEQETGNTWNIILRIGVTVGNLQLFEWHCVKYVAMLIWRTVAEIVT